MKMIAVRFSLNLLVNCDTDYVNFLTVLFCDYALVVINVCWMKVEYMIILWDIGVCHDQFQNTEDANNNRVRKNRKSPERDEDNKTLSDDSYQLPGNAIPSCDVPFNVIGYKSLSPDSQKWIRNVSECLSISDSVELCQDGVGGTYFLKDENQNSIGVFKPIDEEPGAIHNPKNLIQNPVMPPGGGAVREVAAYLIDKNHSGVPETLLLENVGHQRFNNADADSLTPKKGSLQKFIANIGNSESVGSSLFSIDDVHNIGILDIRLLNHDRNAENILITKSDNQYRLIPIDHAWTLPDTLPDQDLYFEWLSWRQSKNTFSEKTLAAIKEIDIDSDSLILRSLGISESAIQYMRFSTIMLKKAAAAGFTLHRIGTLMKHRKNECSAFKKLVEQAKELVVIGKDSVDGVFGRLVDELIGSSGVQS